ncbi:alpha/beta hydrolase [Nocardia sp. NBC_00508]|uniref:alpha/beta fold hydrolase n=1 Tax=Nocardia sp. NBC_00508 TaxID=2975992 RepID=UPI002E7FF533|nr:alpha/beta hydrolase [Nocardia sp. NBC_00508]WUD66525.1 alpha/beta hydrolase [Nocardia sp. NBC_00508]
MTQTPSAVTARTLDVPGAHLYYELRGAGPLVVLVGAPMDAAAFAPSADLLAADHTVLTTDPRGHQNSTLDDPAQDSTPELRADDLARLITHVDAGPAVVFGSSGGAVTALALAQARPDLVTTVIAHEPPISALVADRDTHRAATEDLIATYADGDVLGAWRKFFAAANIPMPEPMLEQMFGPERDPRQVASERYWFAHEIRGTTTWEPDIVALLDTRARLVVGIGADSAGEFCDRTSRALAAALDLVPTLFPGGHIGFVDDPAAFVVRMREILSTL